jgi:ABC-type multidrug transport system ATPase subunit
MFDRVTLLCEGRQIFFGHITEAKGYFENLGFIGELLIYPSR